MYLFTLVRVDIDIQSVLLLNARYDFFIGLDRIRHTAHIQFVLVHRVFADTVAVSIGWVQVGKNAPQEAFLVFIADVNQPLLAIAKACR
jgi:hypothetical protein